MRSNKKRQRRSYSCGPCKLLKIKCDLQTPCYSCKKFKREDKCKADPPQPPSEEELRVIQERKNRMTKRTPSKIKFLSESVTPPSVTSSLGYGHNVSNVMPYTAPSQFPPVRVAEFNNEHEQMLKLKQYFESKDIPFTVPKQENTLSSHVDEKGQSVFVLDLERDSQVQIKIPKHQVNQLKAVFPNNVTFLKLYMNYFKCFNEDLLEIVDYNFLISWGLNIFHYLQEVEYDSDLKINLIELHVLTLNLIIMAMGLFLIPQEPIIANYTNPQLSRMFIDLSKSFKSMYKRTDNLLDVTYLIVWYLILEPYFEYENNCEENHFEYNNLLSKLLFNKEYMDTIMLSKHDLTRLGEDKQPIFPHFKLILKYWLRIRTVELDMLYFQYNSSLLQSNLNFKDSIMPTMEYLTLIYDENLTGLKDKIQGYIFKMAENYFSQFHSNVNQDFKGLVRSYLLLYSRLYNNIKFTDIEEPKVINNEVLVNYLQNQILITVNIKWLGLVKIENSYFPSLRYTIYITSIVSSFNRYLNLDDIIVKQSQGENNLLKSIVNDMSCYHVKFIIHCMIINQIFLLCLKNALHREATDIYVVDIRQLFEICDTKFTTMLQRFTEAFNQLPIQYLPGFQRSICLLKNLNDIYLHKFKFDSNFNVDDFIMLLSNNINVTDFNILVNNYFGGKSTMSAYINKLYDLFKFIKSTHQDLEVRITSNLNFNSELLFSYEHKFASFELDDDTVADYIKTVVEPALITN